MAERWWPSLLVICLLLLPLEEVAAAKIRVVIETPGGIQQRVFLSRPLGLAPDRPVVFVMHGSRRNAWEVRDQWHELAVEHDFLLVVPEFSERHFPGADGYALGNVVDAAGRALPPSDWAFSAIDAAFDQVRRRFGMTTTDYAIYGHAAGAQFVHRFLFHLPRSHVDRAVAAGADWYTLPDPYVDYPLGLKGSGAGPPQLQEALQRPLTVMLAGRDAADRGPTLLQVPESLDSIADRLVRGQAFFAASRAAAAQMAVPFAWRLDVVTGAERDSGLMPRAALAWLLQEKAPPVPDRKHRPRARLPTMLPQTGR